MITNRFDAKLASRKPIDGRDPTHNPVVGRLVLAGCGSSVRCHPSSAALSICGSAAGARIVHEIAFSDSARGEEASRRRR